LPISAPIPAPTASPEDRDEEQHAEQQAPEHAPHRSAADGVMTGVDVVLAFLVTDDHSDRIRLDDQVPRQPPRLFGGELGGGLVRVSDRDQVSHAIHPHFLSLVHCFCRAGACVNRLATSPSSARAGSATLGG
jgi:hypothetical protein